MADDIMDKSTMRRGRPSWYKLEGIGMTGYNDSIILESAIHKILRKYFSDNDYYTDLLHLFQDTIFKTAYGQALDVQTGKEMSLDKSGQQFFKIFILN